MGWQEELTNLLDAYLAVEGPIQCALEMSGVDADDEWHRSHFLGPLEAGIAAAAAGDEAVVRVINSTHAGNVSSTEEAREYLEELRDAYRAVRQHWARSTWQRASVAKEYEGWDLQSRLNAVENKLYFQRTCLVAGTAMQRGKTERAFEEIKAVLEEELAPSPQWDRMEKALEQVRGVIWEQLSFDHSFDETYRSFGALAQVVRLQNQQLGELRQRVELLEQDKPPAA